MRGRLLPLLGAAIALGVWFAVLSGGAAAIRSRDSLPATEFQLETPDMPDLDVEGELDTGSGSAGDDTTPMAEPFATPADDTPLPSSDAVTPGAVLDAPQGTQQDGALDATVPANDETSEQAAIRTVDPAGFSLPADVQGQPLERLPALAPVAKPVETKPRSMVLRRPLVLAAGLVRFGEREIRLAGVAPQQDSRICEAGGRLWNCGQAAKLAFRNHLRARALVCTVPRAKWTGVVEADCTVGGDDPARWLAAEGWAEAPDGSPYAALTEEARKDGRGLFARTVPETVPAALPDPILSDPVPSEIGADTPSAPDLTETTDITDQ